MLSSFSGYIVAAKTCMAGCLEIKGRQTGFWVLFRSTMATSINLAIAVFSLAVRGKHEQKDIFQTLCVVGSKFEQLMWRVAMSQVVVRGTAPSRASGGMQRHLCHTASADLEAPLILMNLIFLHDKLGEQTNHFKTTSVFLVHSYKQKTRARF